MADLPALPDIKLNFSGSMPGEAAFVALIGYVGQVRATMDPALVKRLDAILVQQAEDLQSVWRHLWVKAGVLAAQ